MKPSTGPATRKLPVIFVFQDNGYGISVPKADQTANRKVANNFTGFKNLKIFHCNGKDVFDSMNTMHEAKEYVARSMNIRSSCRPIVSGSIPIPTLTGMTSTATIMN
jgi:2-oxoisovalerate dehydrogenase E1 component